MSDIQKISESEMEIMQIIWDFNAPITTADIHKRLPKNKKWAQSTVLTFLSRLSDKGIVSSEKKGNSNIITAIVTEKQYLTFETKNFLKQVHKGNPKSYVAALIESEELTAEEIGELKKWFTEL